jgi:hypothetical protein
MLKILNRINHALKKIYYDLVYFFDYLPRHMCVETHMRRQIHSSSVAQSN